MALSCACRTIVETFNKYDSDKDGKLTIEEMNLMKNAECDCSGAQEKMEECGKGKCDKSGMSFDEVLCGLNDMMRSKKKAGGQAPSGAPSGALSGACQTIVDMFNKYDKDGDNKLTKAELEEMMDNECDCKEAKKMMGGCAMSDCDGGKSFDDFLGVLNKTLKVSHAKSKGECGSGCK